MVTAEKTPKSTVTKESVSHEAITQMEEVLNPKEKDLREEKLPENGTPSSSVPVHDTALEFPCRSLVDGDLIDSSIQDKDDHDDLEKFEEVDYSKYFLRHETFDTREELQEWVKSTARGHDMFIIVQSSRKNSVYMTCERYGKGRSKRSNIDIESQRSSGTKKCQCPFSLGGRKGRNGVWKLTIMNGKHNHPPATHHHGHSHALVARLSKDQLETIAKLTTSQLKPKEILDHLREEDPSIKTSLRHVYNARQKIKDEITGRRTLLQQLVHCTQETKYVEWHQTDPGTDLITDVMFSHPWSIELLRLFPYVLLMDSTYKNKKCKMSVLEIIGVTPVGKNFNVALAFLRNESEEQYQWALGNLRSLFDQGVEPGVIVTQRELGLMKALDHVLPNTSHLLCLSHVHKSVKSNARKFMSSVKGSGNTFAREKWKMLVDSKSVQEFETNYNKILLEYQTNIELLTYLQETWLVYKERFVRAWTDKVLHFGNTTVDGLESAYLSLKSWLGSSIGDFDIMWKQVNSQLERQISEILAEFVKSSRIDPLDLTYSNFQDLGGCVTYQALIKMEQERLRGQSIEVWDDRQRCGCYMRPTHGLPCAHEIVRRERNSVYYFKDDVHVFWRLISVSASPSTHPQTDHNGEARGKLVRMYKELLSRPINKQKVNSDPILSYMHHLGDPSMLQLADLPNENPAATDILTSDYKLYKFSIDRLCGVDSRGGPLSPVESKDYLSPEPSDKYLGHEASSSSSAKGAKGSTGPDFSEFIPPFLVPYILSSVDVIGDGNCGYRCVAEVVTGNQDNWMRVRNALFIELSDRFDMYASVFGGGQEGEQYTARLMSSLCHWTNTPAPAQRWMALSDMGLVIATHYNAMVLELSNTQNLTHLPLIAPDGVAELSCVMAISYQAATRHFVLLHVSDECPVPPFNPQWRQYRQQSVSYLDNFFAKRRRMWELLSAATG